MLLVNIYLITLEDECYMKYSLLCKTIKNFITTCLKLKTNIYFKFIVVLVQPLLNVLSIGCFLFMHI